MFEELHALRTFVETITGIAGPALDRKHARLRSSPGATKVLGKVARPAKRATEQEE